jgi:hypothetical protein
MGPLPHPGNKESKHGMASFFIPKPKKFQTQPSAGKVMLTLWDQRGVIWSTTYLGGTQSLVPLIQFF